MASYPDNIKSFSKLVDLVSDIVADNINQAYNEIEAIESSLGTNIQGSKDSLKERLAVTIDDAGNLKSNVVGGTSLIDHSIQNIKIYNEDTFDFNSINVGHHSGDLLYGFTLGAGVNGPNSGLTIDSSGNINTNGNLFSEGTFNIESNNNSLPSITLDQYGSANLLEAKRSGISFLNIYKNGTIETKPNSYGDSGANGLNIKNTLNNNVISSHLNSTQSGRIDIYSADGSTNILTVNSDTSGNNVFIGTTTETDLRIKTNSLDRIFIEGDSGFIGINTQAPTVTLEVSGDTKIDGQLNASGGLISSDLNVDSGVLYVDKINNKVGINTTSPLEQLHIQGNELITGNVSASGDLNVVGNITGNGTINVNTIISSGLNIDNGTLYVDNVNNRVGINNTTPSYSIDVSGTGNVSGNVTIGGTLTNSGKITANNGVDTTTLSASNVTIDGGVLRVDNSTNRVGINNLNPQYDFDLIGNENINGNITVTGTAILTGSVSALGDVYTSSINAHDDNGLGLYDNASNGIFIKDGGNVGVNTTNPGYKLDVNGTTNISGNTTLGGTLTITGKTSANGGIDTTTLNVSAGTLFVDSANKRVGINTTSPTDTLHVSGNEIITGNLSVSGNIYVTGIEIVSSTETVSGDQLVGGALTVNGNTQLGNAGTDTVSISGNTTIGGTLINTGQITANGGIVVNGDSILGSTTSNITTIKGKIGVNTTPTSASKSVEIVSISSDDGILLKKGSNIFAQILHNASTDEGAFTLAYAGNAKVFFAANSKSYINNGQYFGIGNNNPSYNLDVTGTGNISSNTAIGGILSITGATSALGNIYTSTVNAHDDNGLGLYDNASNGIFIKDGGNIGIGIADPLTYKLYLNGNAKIASTIGINGENPGNYGVMINTPSSTYVSLAAKSSISTESSIIRLLNEGEERNLSIVKGNTGSTDTYFSGYSSGLQSKNFSSIYTTGPTSSTDTGLIVGTLEHSPLIFGTHSTERVRILYTGEVGIGTDSPGHKLDVVGNIRSSAIIYAPVLRAYSSSGLSIVDATGNTPMFFKDGGRIGIGNVNPQYDIDASGKQLYCATVSATNYIEAMDIYAIDTNGLNILDFNGNYGIFIKDGGNVGIGSSTALEKLYVTGNEVITGNLSTSGNSYLMGLVGIGTTNPVSCRMQINYSSNPQLSLNYNSSVKTTFQTDLNGSMTIDPTGPTLYVNSDCHVAGNINANKLTIDSTTESEQFVIPTPSSFSSLGANGTIFKWFRIYRQIQHLQYCQPYNFTILFNELNSYGYYGSATVISINVTENDDPYHNGSFILYNCYISHNTAGDTSETPNWYLNGTIQKVGSGSGNLWKDINILVALSIY